MNPLCGCCGACCVLLFVCLIVALQDRLPPPARCPLRCSVNPAALALLIDMGVPELPARKALLLNGYATAVRLRLVSLCGSQRCRVLLLRCVALCCSMDPERSAAWLLEHMDDGQADGPLTPLQVQHIAALYGTLRVSLYVRASACLIFIAGRPPERPTAAARHAARGHGAHRARHLHVRRDGAALRHAAVGALFHVRPHRRQGLLHGMRESLPRGPQTECAAPGVAVLLRLWCGRAAQLRVYCAAGPQAGQCRRR